VSLAVIIAAVAGLVASFAAWSLVPLGGPRGEVAAATFVFVFLFALLFGLVFENRSKDKKQ
jgi:hypothetical protein